MRYAKSWTQKIESGERIGVELLLRQYSNTTQHLLRKGRNQFIKSSHLNAHMMQSWKLRPIYLLKSLRFCSALRLTCECLNECGDNS